MPVAASAGYILLLLIGRPPTGTTNPVHLRRVYWIILISDLFTVITKQRMHMHADPEFLHIMPGLFVHILVILKQRFELRWIATNDCEDHRQAMFACTQY